MRKAQTVTDVPETEPTPEPAPVEVSQVPAAEPRPNWAGLLTGTGLALAIVSALAFLGIIAQGFAVQQRLNLFDRLGVAFLQNLDDTPLGLMLIVATVVITLPVVLDAVRDARDDRRAQLALVLIALVAALVAVAAVVGVLPRLRLDDARGQEVTSATRRALATFLVRNFGTALVALGACLPALRLRSTRTVVPPP